MIYEKFNDIPIEQFVIVNDCTLLTLRKAYTSDFTVAMKFFNARGKSERSWYIT